MPGCTIEGLNGSVKALPLLEAREGEDQLVGVQLIEHFEVDKLGGIAFFHQHLWGVGVFKVQNLKLHAQNTRVEPENRFPPSQLVPREGLVRDYLHSYLDVVENTGHHLAAIHDGLEDGHCFAGIAFVERTDLQQSTRYIWHSATRTYLTHQRSDGLDVLVGKASMHQTSGRHFFNYSSTYSGDRRAGAI